MFLTKLKKNKLWQQYFFVFLFLFFIFPLISQATSQSNGTLLRCPTTLEQYNSGDYDQDLTGCIIDPTSDNFLTCTPDEWNRLRSNDSWSWNTLTNTITTEIPSCRTPSGELACVGSGAVLEEPNFPDHGYEVRVAKTRLLEGVGNINMTTTYDHLPVYTEMDNTGLHLMKMPAYTFNTTFSSRNSANETSPARGFCEAPYNPYTTYPFDLTRHITSKLVLDQCGSNLLFKNNRCVECVTDDDCSAMTKGVKVVKGATGKCLANTDGLLMNHTSCAVCEDIGGVNDTGAVEIVFVTNGDLAKGKTLAVEAATAVKNTEPFKYFSQKQNIFSFKFINNNIEKNIGSVGWMANIALTPNKKFISKFKKYSDKVCNQSSNPKNRRVYVFLDDKWPLDSKKTFAFTFTSYDFDFLINPENNPNSLVVFMDANMGANKNLGAIFVHEIGHDLGLLEDEYEKGNGGAYKEVAPNISSSEIQFEQIPGQIHGRVTPILVCKKFDDYDLPKPNCYRLTDLEMRNSSFGISTKTSIMDNGLSTADKFNVISCAGILANTSQIAGLDIPLSDIKQNINYCMGSTTPDGYTISPSAIIQPGK